jgi:hypothetical protein
LWTAQPTPSKTILTEHLDSTPTGWRNIASLRVEESR